MFNVGNTRSKVHVSHKGTLQFNMIALGHTRSNVRVGRKGFPSFMSKSTAVGLNSLNIKRLNGRISNPSNGNSALGYGAGSNNTGTDVVTLTDCTFLGTETGYNNSGTSITNSTAVRAYSIVTESNQIMLGGINSMNADGEYPEVCVPGTLTLSGNLTFGLNYGIQIANIYFISYGTTSGDPLDSNTTYMSPWIMYASEEGNLFPLYNQYELYFSSTSNSENIGESTYSNSNLISSTVNNIYNVCIGNVYTDGVTQSNLTIWSGLGLEWSTNNVTSVPSSMSDLQSDFKSQGIWFNCKNIGGNNIKSLSFVATVFYSTSS